MLAAPCAKRKASEASDPPQSHGRSSNRLRSGGQSVTERELEGNFLKHFECKQVTYDSYGAVDVSLLDKTSTAFRAKLDVNAIAVVVLIKLLRLNALICGSAGGHSAVRPGASCTRYHRF